MPEAETLSARGLARTGAAQQASSCQNVVLRLPETWLNCTAGKSQRRQQRADNKALRKAIAGGEVDLVMGEAPEETGMQPQRELATGAAAVASMQQ